MYQGLGLRGFKNLVIKGACLSGIERRVEQNRTTQCRKPVYQHGLHSITSQFFEALSNVYVVAGVTSHIYH